MTGQHFTIADGKLGDPLSDPGRIWQALPDQNERGVPVQTLVDSLQVSVHTVSRHLRDLRDLGAAHAENDSDHTGMGRPPQLWRKTSPAEREASAESPRGLQTVVDSLDADATNALADADPPHDPDLAAEVERGEHTMDTVDAAYDARVTHPDHLQVRYVRALIYRVERAGICRDTEPPQHVYDRIERLLGLQPPE